ncbi:Rhomboid-like protein 20 [Zea mays]|uniref:Rhomboid-like protein 20 n=1 Tax=Zea mays TaxID=4577 RepID=A0A1D6MQL3_MAIZE|nr:Rhomboid-like protein 20 [Zea mays]
MQGGVSGFQNAPVTRAVVVASGLLSVVFSAQRRARALGISYQGFRFWICCATGSIGSSLLKVTDVEGCWWDNMTYACRMVPVMTAWTKVFS